MENREALKNAGFESKDSPWMTIKNGFKTIYIHPNKLEIEVYFEGIGNAISKHKATDLEDIKAFCYGHLNYYLDFTAKPKYDWETVENKIGNHRKLHLGYIINTLNAATDEGVLSKKECLSMIAKLKLNIIVQQIDRDYPSKDKHRIGTVMTRCFHGGKVELYATDFHTGGYERLITTASVEGAKILLDQNTQLLKNLFKIETDD